MNRRQLFATGVASLLLPSSPAMAQDTDVEESPIMWMLRMLPDLEDSGEYDFAPTTGVNHVIQREVWPENPDKYWDPLGEDYSLLFGFYPSAMSFGAAYMQTSLTNLDNTKFSDTNTIEKLEAHGWELLDEEIRLLHYAGSAQDRRDLADSLHLMGTSFIEGRWDWMSIPDAAHLIAGPDDSLIRPIADRVINFPAITTIDSNFHGLRNILQPEAYYLSLLPPQVLPVQHATAAYISKTWHGETPIVQSIGLRMESADQVEPTIEMIRQRMTTEISSSTDTAYADFLEITDVEIYTSSVRIDFIDTSDSWDIVQKVDQNDLRMLPPG